MKAALFAIKEDESKARSRLNFCPLPFALPEGDCLFAFPLTTIRTQSLLRARSATRNQRRTRRRRRRVRVRCCRRLSRSPYEETIRTRTLRAASLLRGHGLREGGAARALPALPRGARSLQLPRRHLGRRRGRPQRPAPDGQPRARRIPALLARRKVDSL